MQFISENFWKTYRRTVYFDPINACYIKHFHYLNQDWYTDHVKIVNKYFPGYILNNKFNTAKNRMEFKYKAIEGQTFNDARYSYTYEQINSVFEYCIRDIERTWPYKLNDWALSNIIITPNNHVKYVDLDTFHDPTELPSKIKTVKQIKKDFEGGFQKTDWKKFVMWRKHNTCQKLLQQYGIIL